MVLAHQKLILLMAFIAVFITFSKLKSGYHLYSTRALRLMTLGSSLLIFGASIGLIGSMGIFGASYTKSLPFFIAESVFGYVGGWTLIIWGMSEWLPYLFSVTGRLQKKNKSLKLYEAITKVSNYGDASPATFNKIANNLIESYGYQAASLHIPDKFGNLSLYTAVGLPKKSRDLIQTVKNSLYNKVYDSDEIFQSDESIRIHNDIVIETEAGPIVDALASPVNFSTNRVGVMTIYTDHPRIFSQDELGAIDSVCANLGLAFYKDGLQKSIAQNKAFKDFIAVILKTSRSNDNLNTRIIRLAKLFSMYLKFKNFHLYLISGGSPQTLEFNLTGGAKLLVEKGHFENDKYQPVTWVISKKRSLVLPDEINSFDNSLIMRQGLRSLYTPIVVNGEVAGVLCVDTPGGHVFNQNDKIACDAVTTVISTALLEEINSKQAENMFDRIGAIKYSVETAIADKPTNQVYRELARIIVEKMPATFCRIMLLNNQRDSFQTSAIFQRRQLAWDEQTITGLPISELYTHRKVILTGKPEVIKQLDSKLKMSELETKLLMPDGVSQCMINPIIIDGKTRGVVTIGESRIADRNQIGSHEIVFALLLTNVISMLLMHKEQTVKHKRLADSTRLATEKLTNLQNRAESSEIIDNFNSRINGPLAGILASCEFIKANKEMPKATVSRYLDIIDRNAGKIHKLSGQFAEARRTISNIINI